ncbi:MAG: hypothetical protein EP303_05375 [Deltaproteobacteria bacterium]|nr:MAG: hypothetical protein EP303_05375 [Deltaproteobacteria bacterium]
MVRIVRETAHDQLRTAVVGDLALRLANRVIEACAERGIVLMPLKGALFLARWPALRGQRDLVDIDLLVRSPNFEAVSIVLRSLGFEATVRSSASGTFVSGAWPLSIDLHHRLFPHGLFGASTEGIFSRAALDASLFAAPVARMADEDVFAHLIGHFVKGRGTFAHDRSLRTRRLSTRRRGRAGSSSSGARSAARGRVRAGTRAASRRARRARCAPIAGALPGGSHGGGCCESRNQLDRRHASMVDAASAGSVASRRLSFTHCARG